MSRRAAIEHRFVEHIPRELAEGVFYVSIPFDTAVHLCLCGCGEEVVTPLSPMDWVLTYNGKQISLSPSIGNWNLNCRSHYIIRKNKVDWAWAISKKKIDEARRQDQEAKRRYYSADTVGDVLPDSADASSDGNSGE